MLVVGAPGACTSSVARRPDTTLAWLATGLVVSTFPLVARATFDEYTGDASDAASDGAPTEDVPILDPNQDAGPPVEATPPRVDGSTTTFGDDAGGISCAVGGARGGADRRTEERAACCATIGAACAIVFTRRRRSRRKT
jgi:hypothetical protein